MTAETENLPFEVLRGMRGDMAGLGDDIVDLREETAAIRGRLDARIAKLEGTHA